MHLVLLVRFVAQISTSFSILVPRLWGGGDCEDMEHLCESDRGCSSRVETRPNASPVLLCVIGGDKNGSLESETVKYGREFHGTRTRE
jgi:hypothetical protein